MYDSALHYVPLSPWRKETRSYDAEPAPPDQDRRFIPRAHHLPYMNGPIVQKTNIAVLVN